MPDEPTLKQLRERAADLEIEGRSGMDRDELAQAIRAAELAQPGGDSVAVATTDDAAAPPAPNPDEVGRPALADVATQRAERRATTRRVLDAADETQED
jgi:hypothetical protein